MPKSILLFSGGLDSILAAKILEKNDIKVLAITFDSPFFSINNAKIWSKKLGLDLKIINFSNEIISLIKNPPSGFGKNLNPCIDCHASMIKKAGEIMEKENFDFISTGEVVGERPFSQTRQSLERVEKNSEYVGKVLRPLSAKLLPETEAEKFITRDKLYDISGRGREKQFSLAKEFGIKDYPGPGGGCLLTEEGFCNKLNNLMQKKVNFDENDLALLKIGRHFYLGKESQLILGRNKEENKDLKTKTQKGDLFFDSKALAMPCAILRISKKDLENAEAIKQESREKIISFSKKGLQNPRIDFL